MARRGKVAVSIVADSSGLSRGLRKGEQDLSRFERTGAKSLGHLKTAAMGAGAALTGGLVIGLKQSVDAAMEAEKSNARMAAQLKALGINYRAHADQIDKVIQKTSKLAGLDDEDLQDAFTNVVRATGSVNVALGDMALVADLARARHMDVAKAGDLVAKVHQGNVGALKRLGLGIEQVTTAQDALKSGTTKATVEQTRAAKEADKTATAQKALGTLQSKLGGQAEAYGKTAAGSQERFQVAVENLKEAIGETLLPTVTDIATKASDFVDQMQRGTGAGGRFAGKLKSVYNAIKPIAQFFGDHPALIAVAVGAWATYRTAAAVALAKTKLQMLGMFGGATKAKIAAEAATTGTATGTAFRSAFLGAATLGLAAVVAKAIDEIQKGPQHFGDKAGAYQKALEAYQKNPSEANRKKVEQAGTALNQVTGGGGKVTVPKKKSSSKKHSSRSSIRARASAVATTSATRSGSRGGTSLQIAGALAKKHHLKINSGYRTPAHNKAVGGVPGSDHTKGTPSNPGAVDLGGSVADMQAAAAEAHSMGIGTLIHDAGSGLHLHLSFAGGTVGDGTAPLTKSGGVVTGTTQTAATTAVSKPSLLERFQSSIDLIGLRESAGKLSESQAARATIRATTKALKRTRKGSRTHLEILAARRQAQARLKEIASSKAEREEDARLQREQDAQEAADKAEAFKEAYGGTGFTDAALTMAQVETPGDTSDDRAVLAGRLGLAQSYYGQAKASGDEAGITKWGQAVLDLKSSIDSLNASVEASLEQQLELQKQSKEDFQRLYNTSQAQYPVLVKAMADAISGEIGGKVGLGLMTPGYSGGGVRY